MEYIIIIMVQDMLDNLQMEKEMVKVFIIIRMVIVMKVIGKMIKEKEKVFIIILMVIEKWEII